MKLVQVVALYQWSEIEDIYQPCYIEVDMECESDSQLTFIPLSIAIKSITEQDHNHPSTQQIPCKHRCIVEISFLIFIFIFILIFIFQHQPGTYQQQLAERIMKWI